MKKLSFLACGLFLLAAFGCATQAPHDGYIIEGTLGNLNEGTLVFLDEIDGRTVNVLDTAKVDSKGHFEMKGKVAQKGLGRLRIGAGAQNVMLILNNENYRLEGDIQDMQHVHLHGSPESVELRDLMQKIQTRQVDANYLKAYADTVKSPFLSYVAVSNLPIEEEYDTYKKVLKRMRDELPGLALTKEFENHVASMEGVLKTAVGSPAPEIELSSPDGESIPLSSLKGKIVLVDFWASWCKPCRRENPHVVEVYKKYKSKGFDVYSVSLDSNKDRWVSAIEQDGLAWDGHVSDLGGWGSSAAALYNVRSIPQTFLLDKDGKIIAKNLRGSALEQKLQELLGGA